MPIEKTPSPTVSKNYVPPNSRPYKVKDGDSWESVAESQGMPAWNLIRFNYPYAKETAEVNWYLRRYVGCVQATPDGKNWTFSSAATPGIIHLPTKRVEMEDEEVISKLPKPAGPKAKKYVTTPFDKLWFGLGLKGSIMAVAGGLMPMESVIFNSNYFDHCFGLFFAAYKYGLGLGASGGPVVVIISGMSDPKEIHNTDHDGGFDWQLSVGGKWDSLLRAGKVGKKLAEGGKMLGELAKSKLTGVWQALKQGKLAGGAFSKAVQAAAKLELDEWLKIHELMKFALKDIWEAELNPSKPHVAVIDVPLAGGGTEISAYKWKAKRYVHLEHRPWTAR